MTAEINKIVKVPDAMKTPDFHMLYNEAGDYFIGSKKECDEYIKKNNLTVVVNVN